MPGRGRGRPPHPDILTPAEQRVLDELRKGGTNVEIAVRLGLSPETVKTHIARMLGKLDLDDRHALAAWWPAGERRRFAGALAIPATLASAGRPLLWAAATLAGMAVVTVVVVVLVALRGGDPVPVAVPATPSPQVPRQPISFPEPAGDPALEAATCGDAVPDPHANAELVRDCASLLKARDRLAGDATLNWSADLPLAQWTGVTVAGTPPRVTKLDLSDHGLKGELTGLLGNLVGLTELRLDGNELTGGIPSKLQLLTALTHLYLHNDALTGCVSALLRNVPDSDLAALNLPDCPPPLIASGHGRKLQLEGGQTVSYQHLGRGHFLVVDLPEGHTFTIEVSLAHRDPGWFIAVVVTNADGYKSQLVFDPGTGEEFYRVISGAGGIFPDGRTIGEDPSLIPESPLNDVFQRISESAWWLTDIPCDAGLAVPDPAANPELMSDCETLLRLQERFGEPSTFTWNAWWPVAQWTGVTVGGTPQRVTKLDLTRRELRGELSGLVGDLTGLTELRLDYNRLTGALPSKLQQLTGLTHFSMIGNLFTGCLPTSLRNVTTDDRWTPDLPICPTPIAVHEHTRKQQLEGGQTVSYKLRGIGPALVVDLPEGYTFTAEVISGDPVDPETTPSTMVAIVITDAEGYTSAVAFNPDTGKEVFRSIVGEGITLPGGRRIGAPTGDAEPPNPLHEVFDRVADSAWLQE